MCAGVAQVHCFRSTPRQIMLAGRRVPALRVCEPKPVAQQTIADFYWHAER